MEEEKQKLLQVKSDILFSDLFNENEMQTLEWVAMQILECKYEDIHGNVKIGNVRRPRVSKNEKVKYVDLIINYKNEYVILELNNNFRGDYTRNLMYAFNRILNNYDKDDLTYYKKMIRVILVNLNWFYDGNDFGLPGKDVYELPYPNYKKQGYILKVINANLDYYKNLCYDKIMKGDKLYKLLTVDNQDDLKNLVKCERLLDSYSKKLIDLSNDDLYKEKIMNERIEKNLARQEGYFEGIEEGIEQGIEKGIEQGIEQGNLEKTKEIVLNMHDENYKLDDISKITKLTTQEIQNIINQEK